MSTPRPQDGQVAPLVALLALLCGLAALGLGRLGGIAVARTQAATAADAAALAGAAADDDAATTAARYAGANGARLDGLARTDDGVRVRVRVGRVVAVARAARSPGDDRIGADAGAAGLAPAMRAALARAAQVLGRPVPVTSGYRSAADQARLYARRAGNPYPVAPPGSSMHERGLAVDVPLEVAEQLAAHHATTGLCRPYPRTDPVHFELCPSR